MVKLSELGITPSPWRVITVNGKLEAVESCLGIDSPKVCNAKRMKEADAQIMSAAPDMYEAGRKTEEVLTKLLVSEFDSLNKSGAADALIACREELRSALANAGGMK